MKLILACLLPCLFLSTAIIERPSLAPDKEEAKSITALKLSASKAKLYRAVSIAAFRVDAKGVLRPQKNYEMYLLSEGRKVIIRPTGWEHDISAYGGGYEEVPLPDGNGIAACMCEKGPDDCHFEATDEHGPDRDDYECTGRCGCSLYIVLDEDKGGILDYETAGGRWFNF